MESRPLSELTPSETPEARGRSKSSSPHQSNPQHEAPPRGRKRRGVEDWSPSAVKRIRQEIESIYSKPQAEQTEYQAEQARRLALSSDERLQEDGDELQKEIEADPEMFVTLEVSASQRARCRADSDCVYMQAKSPNGNIIRSNLRICVHEVDNMEWYGRTKHYYHVICFAFMIELTDLLPEKFKLDGASRWGLMWEKWFEHAGRIDLDKIEKHLEDFDTFETKHGEYNEWWLTHAEHCEDEESEVECKYGCPPRPERPSKPELRDYTKEDGDACIISDVLKHRLAMKRIPERWMTEETQG